MGEGKRKGDQILTKKLIQVNFTKNKNLVKTIGVVGAGGGGGWSQARMGYRGGIGAVENIERNGLQQHPS